jgi:sulfotransferase
MVEKIFYQSSLPRAGSTMLQNIMAQNPEIYATPTSGVLELVFAARSNYTNSPEFKAQDGEVMKTGFLNFCREGMFGFYNVITDKPYVVDKSRGWGIHYGFLETFYPEPKVVCMIRDPRSIYASMEKNFRKNQHLDSGIVDHAQMQGTTTEKRIDIWTQGQPVGLAMERLYQVIKEGINKKMLFVKFEDLCRYPEQEMKKIYTYLDVPYYQHDFDNIEQITQEDDSVYGIYGDHVIKSKLTPVKNDYKEVLGVNASNWIRQNFSWFYDEFRYI